MPDSTLSTLEQIQIKVRRITRSPSPALLSDNDLNNYINSFVLYDFPEHLRLFNLRTVFTWYAAPYIDTYETNTIDPNSPFFNFKNKYISIHPPAYVAGFKVFYTQSREEFYNIYPKINSIRSIGFMGNGVTVSFAGNINNLTPLPPSSGQIQPVLQRQVLFSSIDNNNNPLALVDTPISATIGNLSVPDQPPTSTIVQDPFNFINYVTGQYVITFTTPPGVGQPINSQTFPYAPARPLSILFYDTKFILRPVPDQPYRIDLEAYLRPTELLEQNQMPELSEWWEYIATGAARKVFEDRMDYESLNLLMPLFKEKERLILRRTLVQYSNERTATIYTQQTAGMYGPGWFFGGSQF